VLGVDLVPDRLERARSHGVETLDLREHEDDLVETVRAMTDGRGPDSVLDAVGMEAHGAPVAKLVQTIAGLLPDPIQLKLMEKAGVDRMHALYLAIELVRRGGTISISGVYGGTSDPMPLRVLFDKQVQIRMGQANVLRWVPEIMPLLLDGDPLGTDSFASHHVPIQQAPEAYEKFQKKDDGFFKVVLHP
jgi:threonine dehydrogenase-like Zn-dependent dehydrogenase